VAANIKELILALSGPAQSAIDTVQTDVFRINTIGQDLTDIEPVVEDDADEVGKGHEFAEESTLSHWDVKRKIDVYLSAEMLAWACAYGLGVGTGGTFEPIDPTTNANEIELPWATIAEGIRPTGTAVLNRAYLGMVVNDFEIDIKNGPGKANSKLMINLVGTGKYVEPSGVTFPTTKTTCNLQPSASLTCTIHGVNYVTEKNFESFNLKWNNNVREGTGFFPGAGFQTTADATTGAVRGRMEFGDRKLEIGFVTRMKATSTEFAKLIAQSAGTVAIGTTGANSTSAAIALPQIKYTTNKIDNSDGIVTLGVNMSAQVPSGSTVADLITFTIAHGLGTIGRA
jgi:hypothetical protein